MESQHFKIESDTKSRYEGILSEKLQELRDLYDTEAKQYRDETDNLYGSKVRHDYDNSNDKRKIIQLSTLYNKLFFILPLFPCNTIKCS